MIECDTNSLPRLREVTAVLGPLAGIATTSEFYLVSVGVSALPVTFPPERPAEERPSWHQRPRPRP